jgi:hypothetical protein
VLNFIGVFQSTLPRGENDASILNPEIQSVHITAAVETMKETGMEKSFKYISIKYQRCGDSNYPKIGQTF